MTKIIRLTESDLARIVKRVINEENKKDKRLNEGVLMTLGGLALGGAVVKKAYDYIKNRQLKNKMTETGNLRKSDNGKFTMKEYKDNETGEIFFGIDLIDKTRDEGFQDRNVLLFKGDDEDRIERILNSEIKYDFSDEGRMDDDHDRKFGQFRADKVIKMGRS